MIRNNKLLIAAGAAALTASMYTSAVTAASINGTAAANVITPLGISETTGLNFGDVSVGTGGGTVSIDFTNGRTATGDAEAVTGGTTPAAGAYLVTGTGTKTYSISLPGSTTITDGAVTMTVNGFSHNAGATPALSGGTDTFNIGATLNINGGQAVNAYSGTFPLTVNYQ